MLVGNFPLSRCKVTKQDPLGIVKCSFSFQNVELVWLMLMRIDPRGLLFCHVRPTNHFCLSLRSNRIKCPAYIYLSYECLMPITHLWIRSKMGGKTRVWASKKKKGYGLFFGTVANVSFFYGNFSHYIEMGMYWYPRGGTAIGWSMRMLGRIGYAFWQFSWFLCQYG